MPSSPSLSPALPSPRTWRKALPWPLPAVLAWALGWGLWAALTTAHASPALGFGLGMAAAGLAALACRGTWRRAIAALGFPLSALVCGVAAPWPAWGWLLLLLPLLAAYPLRAWADAPFFPTPAAALEGLDEWIATPARVLDAGCGLGHGLQALHRLWPQAALTGLEWSPALAWVAARRCRYARVRRGDMWAASWSGHDVVYLFQRPESMARALAKARRELAPGAWLVSLEFAVPDELPSASLQGAARRPVWLYRMPVP
jgi:SAM-dependent methyltransferase